MTGLVNMVVTVVVGRSQPYAEQIKRESVLMGYSEFQRRKVCVCAGLLSKCWLAWVMNPNVIEKMASITGIEKLCGLSDGIVGGRYLIITRCY